FDVDDAYQCNQPRGVPGSLSVAGAFCVRFSGHGCVGWPRKRTASACHPDSARHVLKLGDIERLRPCEPALGEHLERRLDALRAIQATERDEDRSWKALQVGGEDPRAAIRAEVPIQPLARLRDVMKCFWPAAD